ncbi:MAG: HTTM domain-containing protein [Pirellulaceae bacterium]|nr:HTTM domain-containing protein [Pirellulaceae bacterium]
MSSQPHTDSSWLSETLAAWNRFWFTPSAPHTLAVIRIFCGAMLVYVHAIWLSQANDFFGPDAWIDATTARELHEFDYIASYLMFVSNPWLISLHQLLAMSVCLLMAVGWMTRWVTPLAWFLTLMVCHRQTGALFGLDQVVMMLSMYLMLCPCGAVYSLDAWLAQRRPDQRKHDQHDMRGSPADKSPSTDVGQLDSVAITISSRLLQLHLCIIYMFGGLSKMRGDLWWEGSAMWWSIVNYEYQSLNITWLGLSPLIIATITHVTLFWETFYPALIWSRLTRPLTLAMAVLVHGGIAVALGMPTFGLMMIVANMVFISPSTMQSWLQRINIGR